MITLPKRKIRAHLISLFKKIDCMQKDTELLGEWSKATKVMPAQRLALILKDSVEDVASGLKDLRGLVEDAIGSFVKR